MRKILRISFEGETYEVEVDNQPFQNSQTSTMNLLKEIKNKSRKDCKDFFSRYSGESLSDGSILEIETEKCFSISQQYKCSLVKNCQYNASGKIFKTDAIRFEVNQIELTNCVFFGGVDIVLNGDNSNVMIDKSFIFGYIRIFGKNSNSSVVIQGSALDRIEIRKQFGSIELVQSTFGWLVFYNATVFDLSLYDSFVEVLRIGSDSKVNISEKGMFKIDVKKTLTTKNITEEWVRFPMDISAADYPEKDYEEAEINETEECAQFLERNNFCTTVDEHADLTYYKNLVYLKLPWSFFYKIFGGMIKPAIIIAWYFGLIILFAVVFAFGKQPFADNIDNSFWNSLYFSVITMTSVGYGDIKPVEWAQLCAAIEGILGVFLGGAFLVALTRKYFSR